MAGARECRLQSGPGSVRRESDGKVRSLLESIQARPVEGNFVKLLLTASVKKLSILKVIVRELADLGADQLAMIRVGRSSAPLRFWDSEAAFRDDNGLEPDSGGSGRRGAGGRSGLGGAEFDALKAQSAAMQSTMQAMTVEMAKSQKLMATLIKGVVSTVSAVAEFTSARILEVTGSQAKMAQDMAVNLEKLNSDTPGADPCYGATSGCAVVDSRCVCAVLARPWSCAKSWHQGFQRGRVVCCSF